MVMRLRNGWAASFVVASSTVLVACDAQNGQVGQNGPSTQASEAELPPEVRAGVERMFAAFDRNQDGVITRAELEAAEGFVTTDSRTGQMLSETESVEFFFEQFDLNGDGRVTREEMTQAARQLMQQEAAGG